MSIEIVYDYFRNYDKSTYQVVACMGNEPSNEDINVFEDEIGIKLPQEFREFTMSSLGGLYMNVHEEIWPQAKAFDVAPFWSFLRGIIVFGIAEGIPDFLDIRVQKQELEDFGLKDYVPFLKIIGNGDEVYCFDMDGNIVLVNYYETEEVHIINETFSQLLMLQIEALEERKNKKLKMIKTNNIKRN